MDVAPSSRSGIISRWDGVEASKWTFGLLCGHSVLSEEQVIRPCYEVVSSDESVQFPPIPREGVSNFLDTLYTGIPGRMHGVCQCVEGVSLLTVFYLRFILRSLGWKRP
jgi:hypothetical protein